jgi:type I restriction enzyme M protein
MNTKTHNKIISFIWNIADDVLRGTFDEGKYRDIILPFTVLRRLDALLVPTKDKVLKTFKFMEENKIDDKSALTAETGYPFWNSSNFTFKSLLEDTDHIDSNLETYLDGYSDNVQQIISKFKLKNQLETLKEAEITCLLLNKFASSEINLTPYDTVNSKGIKLPALTTLGMGYVFEELIRKFNEDNNAAAGKHFTPREVIKLMTNILFVPVKDKIAKGTYLIYDPACGTGGMLIEAENHIQQEISEHASCVLYGQELNPETYAICTSDMLIRGEQTGDIAFGSTLSKDGFSELKFDFMLSNPPYGVDWEKDESKIVRDRGKKGKEEIKDHRFKVGLPTISDGQLLFLQNMISKMKHDTELGSRIASVHNGSALFSGNAGGGESEIRKSIIENDLLECIIALPKNIFYNTGIPTYVWIVNNKKAKHRKGKVQLINALELYTKLRKNLGAKNCELTSTHIEQITQLYLDFKPTDISKIYPNEYFGYNKITVERPLQLSAKFTTESIASLRFTKNLVDEMSWIYKTFGDAVYSNLAKFKPYILDYLDKNNIKLKANPKKNLLDQQFWNMQLELLQNAEQLMAIIGCKQYDDVNILKKLIAKTVKRQGLKLNTTAQNLIIDVISWTNEEAKPVISKIAKDGTISYKADPDLRDTENIPLSEDIETYFQREVLEHVPDAWIDYNKTVVGYELSFTRYFYNYTPPRNIETITAEILQLEQETDGILRAIVSD